VAKLIKIGRSKENDIVISETSVSRFHAELFQDDEGNIFITDLNSTNGTTINGVRLVGSQILQSNDIVKLGNSAPLPWRTYFPDSAYVRETSRPVSSGTSSEPIVQVGDARKSNGQIKAIVISIALVFIAVVMLLFRDELFSSSTDSNTDMAEQDQVTVNKDGSTAQVESKTDETAARTPVKNIPQPTQKEINYDYSCMDNQVLNDMNELESEFIGMFDETVSLSEEVDVGRQLYDGCRNEYRFVNDYRLRKIESIKDKLNQEIRNKRGFNYKIYLIESDQINAFTAGGYIFVTTAMYSFTNSDDELACVIGHEMAHNECKHINQNLKKQKVNRNLFGDFFGSAADALSFFLTSGFNQKNETECDFHGIDYAVSAGYNSCKVIGLWERMSQKESQGDEIDAMMRSHPYSANRSQCCRNHIESNYSFSCPN
jgi:hypothetical protein